MKNAKFLIAVFCITIFVMMTAAASAAQSIDLKPGWNQISSPIAEGIDISTIEQFCTILQYKNQKLWSWNSEAQSWTNPTKVEPFRGHWIYIAYTCTVPISGTPATFSSLQLYSGWNKVSASGALSAISGTCSGHIMGNWIWNWDKATERWIHPTAMQLDKGYWIKVDADCVMNASTDTPDPIPVSKPSYIIYTDGAKVYAKNGITENVDYSGTLNQVLSSTLKSGNHVYIKNGAYSLNTIELQSNVTLECESNNAVIKTTTTSTHLIYMRSDSTIKGCTFEHNGGRRNIIYVYGKIKNWNIIGNRFVNTDNAVSVVNTDTTYPPTNGYGLVSDNTGLHSKLGGIENGQHITFKNNKFYDFSGAEFFDFNGNVHYSILEDNIFVNGAGYTISDEAIDMIGFNNNNIVKNNRIIANFQRGIGPRYEASNNLIEGNYIEFKSGTVSNEGGIVLWNSGAVPSKIPSNNKIIRNTIINTKIGITLSGAQGNTVTENTISKTGKGISITKDTYKGANAVSKNNMVTKNTITNVDYGIYIVSSPSNTISDNTITGYRISAIYNSG